MACILKAPEGPLKGCVTFTTPERDTVINISPAIRSQIEALKNRYVVGLHHNWHDHQFQYDPLFDFSMAADGDLVEVNGRSFPRIPLDATDFVPPCYSAPRRDPFWDILAVARAVNFKGIPEFFQAIRNLYDNGHKPRVLFLCPLPVPVEIPGIDNLRDYFEAMFSPAERLRVTFLTLDWDYPFPLDSETLAYFYRSSKIYFHSAPNERRARTAAYAWAGGMPVVANRHLAGTLPAKFRRQPFLFSFGEPADMPGALIAALNSRDRPDKEWDDVSSHFSSDTSAARLNTFLNQFAAEYGWGSLSAGPICDKQLDIRIARHHGISLGLNKVDLSISEFCRLLSTMTDSDIASLCRSDDPELEMLPPVPATLSAGASPSSAPYSFNPKRRVILRILKKIGLFRP